MRVWIFFSELLTLPKNPPEIAEANLKDFFFTEIVFDLSFSITYDKLSVILLLLFAAQIEKSGFFYLLTCIKALIAPYRDYSTSLGSSTESSIGLLTFGLKNNIFESGSF